ncbi:hypothetical protein J0A71_01g02080 [Encephalitozoon cuniculi]|nr:hypothetical protein J0A71_01g02080 [Encephalitozoon cuniculi]
MPRDMVPEDYLNKDFDYTKLTKTQLRRIMYENGVEAIPPITAKKSELLDAYKENIHDRINVLVSRKKNISMDNPFQASSPKKKYTFSEIPGASSGNESPNKKTRSEEPPASNTRISRKGEKAPDGSPSENFSLKKFSCVGSTSSVQGKGSVSIEDKGLGASSLIIDSSAANNSTVDFSGSSLSSSFIHSSSEECPSASRGGDRGISNSELRKRAFTSDPTLDKPDSKSRHSSPRSVSSNSTRSSTRPKPQGRKGRWCLVVLSTIGFAAAIYFRFICPYCPNGKLPCIPLPEHSRVVDGRLVCDKGFMVRYGIFRNYCTKDNRREKEVQKKVKELRKTLERRSGDYMYKMAPTKAVPIELLTKDPEVAERLKKEVGIVISNGMVYSVNTRVSARTFFRYYLRRILMISTPLAVMVGVVRAIRMFKKKKEERLHMARKIMKDIADVLVRQIYVSTRNASFPSYVYIEQLKDCFGVDKRVWREVESMILANSNIRESCVEGRRAWEWVGPILYKPEFNGSLF